MNALLHGYTLESTSTVKLEFSMKILYYLAGFSIQFHGYLLWPPLCHRMSVVLLCSVKNKVYTGLGIILHVVLALVHVSIGCLLTCGIPPDVHLTSMYCTLHFGKFYQASAFSTASDKCWVRIAVRKARGCSCSLTNVNSESVHR